MLQIQAKLYARYQVVAHLLSDRRPGLNLYMLWRIQAEILQLQIEAKEFLEMQGNLESIRIVVTKKKE